MLVVLLLSLGPVVSGWSPIKLTSVGFVHSFSKIFSKRKEKHLRDTSASPEFVCKWENDDFIDSTSLELL